MMAFNSFLLSSCNGIRTIQFNRPELLNAINTEMYRVLVNTLSEDSKNPTIQATILTGSGNYFSSGNDFSKASMCEFDNEIVSEASEEFLASIINYPKLLIAVVNGPAIGIATTLLNLCDIVYASDRATFNTPFLRLGICPDSCASYAFPRAFGNSKATELSLLGAKITAEEALQYGFVARVIPHEKLDEFVETLQTLIRDLSVGSIKSSKKLLMAPTRDNLYNANRREFKKLREICGSSEFLDRIFTLFGHHSKL